MLGDLEAKKDWGFAVDYVEAVRLSGECPIDKGWLNFVGEIKINPSKKLCFPYSQGIRLGCMRTDAS